MILQWEASKLSDLGAAVREDGRAVRRLALALDEALTLFVEIDTDTFRILRTAGVMTVAGIEIAFGASYSDPTAFSDLVWSAREDQSAMGRATGWTRIETIEILP